MTDIEELSENARAVAEKRSKQGTFSFLDRLAGREYPTEDVEIFLDEATGHKIQKLNEDLVNSQDAAQSELLEKQIASLSKKAHKSRYIVHLEGIPVEEYDAVVDDAQKQFPLEYKEGRNPLTMAPEREPIPNEDRDVYFRTQLWSKFIRSVEDADGNIDSNITPEWIAVVLGKAPIIAQARIQQGVESLRMVSSWMDEIQGEDFLAKS